MPAAILILGNFAPYRRSLVSYIFIMRIAVIPVPQFCKQRFCVEDLTSQGGGGYG